MPFMNGPEIIVSKMLMTRIVPIKAHPVRLIPAGYLPERSHFFVSVQPSLKPFAILRTTAVR
jgi:hypothetical protein